MNKNYKKRQKKKKKIKERKNWAINFFITRKNFKTSCCHHNFFKIAKLSILCKSKQNITKL